MSCITQKDLYEDAILRKSRDHKSQTKLIERLNTVILWEEVWNSVHSSLHSNNTKTAIWEQLHLNFYTQYSYNKWHNTLDLCPLCHELPSNIYHTMLDCTFTNTIWTDLQPMLGRFRSIVVNDQEKTLGLVDVKSSSGTLLRNWVTYKVREQIIKFQRKAYPPGRPDPP